MQSVARIKASDGSGNASIVTIQNVRSPGATTIVGDTVSGLPSGAEGFYATMGTPHTFIDPVTSEEITVISEATAVDFSGHVDAGNIEIDDIAPGYTDLGSAVGDIVVIRPTTQWSDNVSDVLAEEHADDGSHSDVTLDSLKFNSQGLSALTFDGWLQDSNTWVYVSGTGTVTGVFKIVGVDATGYLAPGMRIKCTQSATVKYGIITKVAFSTDTTVTLLMSATSGTVDNTGLANATISSPAVSREKAPFGFPLDPARWTIKVAITTDNLAASSANTWKDNSLSITVPIGSWKLGYQGTFYASMPSATGTGNLYATLSTSNNSESDSEFRYGAVTKDTTATHQLEVPMNRTLPRTITSVTTYYLLVKSASASNVIGFAGNDGALILSAECAYL